MRGHTINIHLKSCIWKVNVIFHWRCRNVIQPVNQACPGRGECVASESSRRATRPDYDLLPASWVVYGGIINVIANYPRIVVLNNSFASTLSDTTGWIHSHGVGQHSRNIRQRLHVFLNPSQKTLLSTDSSFNFGISVTTSLLIRSDWSLLWFRGRLFISPRN